MPCSVPWKIVVTLVPSVPNPLRMRATAYGAMSARTMDDYLVTFCNGPPIDNWDPRPSVESWYTSGKWQRRILTKRKRKDKACKRGPRAKVQPDRENLCRAVVHCLGTSTADKTEVPVCPPSHPNPDAESDVGVVSASEVEDVSPASTSDSSSAESKCCSVSRV